MIQTTSFGKLADNRSVKLYTITNKNNVQVKLSEYGAAIVGITVPDRCGNFSDVVLGFSDASGYETQKGTYFGATIGRFANRIRNGRFMLSGKPVILNSNDGKNTLHGGNSGFDRKLWTSEIYGESSIKFTCESPDGDENFPGNLTVSVKFTLSDTNTLEVDYTARTDADTILNLTNHSYFNLKGHDAGNAGSQVLRINANNFTGIDRDIVPDGTIMPVECTPMDFRNYARINSRIDVPYIQLKYADGYDHNWVLNKRERNILSLAAELYDDVSGRYMTVHTTKPGIQFYSGNFLPDGIIGKDGCLYMKRGGICLETQLFPNAMEHTHFPCPILRADDVYHHITRFTFSVKDIDPKCFS